MLIFLGFAALGLGPSALMAGLDKKQKKSALPPGVHGTFFRPPIGPFRGGMAPEPAARAIFGNFWVLYGWIGHPLDFLCICQNHDHRDRRGLFSIHKKYGLLNRHPKKVSFFDFD